MTGAPAIPAFLRRQADGPAPKPRKPRTVRRKSRPSTVTVHLTDQAPRIGSGHRQVEVRTVGRKWVTVRSWPGGSQCEPVRHKFKRADWERITK